MQWARENIFALHAARERIFPRARFYFPKRDRPDIVIESSGRTRGNERPRCRAAPKLIRPAFRVSVTNISFASPRCKYQTSNINSYDFIIRAISAAYRPVSETRERWASRALSMQQRLSGHVKRVKPRKSAGKPSAKRDSFGHRDQDAIIIVPPFSKSSSLPLITTEAGCNDAFST